MHDYVVTCFSLPNNLYKIACSNTDISFEITNYAYDNLKSRFVGHSNVTFEQALFLVLLRYKTAMGDSDNNEGTKSFF